MQLKLKININKVLHVVPSYFPAIKLGGPIESVRNLNIELVKLGLSVDVLTTTAGIEKTVCPSAKDWMNDKDVRVKYLPSYFYDNYTFAPQLLFQALSNVNDYDLVHITAFWNFPVLAGSLAAIINKKPYIISPRGVLYEDAINIKSAGIKQLYYQLVSKYYLTKANAVHFTTEDEKNNVAGFIKLPKRQFVVPNGIDVEKYRELPFKGQFRHKYSIPEGKKVLLYLGRIHKQKGLDLLLDSFCNLCANDQNLVLAIVGPDVNNYSSVLKSKLKQTGLLSKSLFTGLLTGVNKLEALVDSDVFVLSSYFENFGMSVIEAMACGIPVVISNRVGISEDVRKNNAGIVVDLTCDSVSAGIKDLLESDSKKVDIAKRGKQLVFDRYNISVVGKNMLDAYREVLSL